MKNFFLILLLIFAFFNPCFAQEDVLKAETGIVKNIEYVEGEQFKQVVDVQVLSGKFKGEKVVIDNVLTNNPFYDILLKKNDKVVLHLENSDNGVEFFIADLQRVNALYLLLAIFVGLVLMIGKKRGLMSLIATGLIVLLVFAFLSPMILIGINPVFATILLSILASSIAIYFVGGINYKSTSAVLGTVVSLTIAGILSVFIIKIGRLTGFSSEDSLYLLAAHPELNFVGILTSAMIIATLGAVIDVGMSIASCLNELFEVNSEMTFKDLFDSGMNVGKDIIGTMTNTLILLYVGSSLPLVLLAHNIDMMKFFNLNMVVTEISSALVGSIALVICVPITALITAYLIRLKPNEDVEFNDEE